jgi:hypothetical protein
LELVLQHSFPARSQLAQTISVSRENPVAYLQRYRAVIWGTEVQTTYRATLRRFIKYIPNFAKLSICVEDPLSRFNSCGASFHLQQCSTILFLIPHSLHFRSCRIKEAHSGPIDTFELRSFLLGFIIGVISFQRRMTAYEALN